VESNAQSDAQADAPSAAAQPAAGPGWPRRAALRAAAGLGLAVPLTTAACGASNPAGPSAGRAGGSGAATAPRNGPASAAAIATGSTAIPRAGATASAPAAVQPGSVIEVARGSRAADAIALTFHGSGPPAMATALLAEAERAGARVTVMVVGSWLKANPQLAERILDGGHELGNHTEHHLNISALSPVRAYTEIEACADRLRKLTGSQGRWFRPSQAQHATAQVRAAAARAGYRDVLSYDVDPKDYADPGSAAVVRNVLSVIGSGDVVSMHMGHRGTITALPAILDGLRTRGLRAITADALFPVQAGPARPPVPSQEAGRQ
jgi:peptidoglycan/xylan/chitin deacetylase (PgdA/CDA1 family)